MGTRTIKTRRGYKKSWKCSLRDLRPRKQTTPSMKPSWQWYVYETADHIAIIPDRNDQTRFRNTRVVGELWTTRQVIMFIALSGYPTDEITFRSEYYIKKAKGEN